MQAAGIAARGRPGRPRARSPASNWTFQAIAASRSRPSGRSRSIRPPFDADRIAAGQAHGPGHMAGPVAAMRHGEHQRHTARARDIDHRLGGQLHGREAGIDVVRPLPHRATRGPTARTSALEPGARLRCSGSGRASCSLVLGSPSSIPAKACARMATLPMPQSIGRPIAATMPLATSGKQQLIRRLCGETCASARATRDVSDGLEHGRRAQSALGDQSRPAVAGTAR